ncbi:MAG: enoyl-CoA hydratase/isomerase family protein [Acidobacteria bacterium]|nr:enoyl-CoA hydratase/isomerase family protein [Acidobacteriota bacterium]
MNEPTIGERRDTRAAATSPRDGFEIHEERGVHVLVINRPRRRNALTREVRLDLADWLRRAGDGPDARPLVIASRESAFSAGQDLSEAKDFEPEYITAWIEEHMSLYRAILSYPRPVLAAVDGCCVGAGLQMALLCDLRIGSPESFFAMPELEDAIPCILGVWALWDVIGRGRTTEMVLTNRRVYADEALQWGLLNQIQPAGKLLERTVDLALDMAAKPALAFRLTKDRLRLLALQEEEALAVHASYAHTAAFASGQPRQKMQEFLDQGRPVVKASREAMPGDR